MVSTAERRERQREALVVAAERAIEARGLAGLRVRDLAAEIGCALGAVYNLVADLDELVLRVGSRTLARLDEALAAAAGEGDPATPEEATGRLVAIALAYARFARGHLSLWRALFEHRMAEGAAVPEWAVAQQTGMFRHVTGPLRVLVPAAGEVELGLLARTLFSAVHGVVLIGLEEKLVAVPREALDRQLSVLVRATCRGLAPGG